MAFSRAWSNFLNESKKTWISHKHTACTKTTLSRWTRIYLLVDGCLLNQVFRSAATKYCKIRFTQSYCFRNGICPTHPAHVDWDWKVMEASNIRFKMDIGRIICSKGNNGTRIMISSNQSQSWVTDLWWNCFPFCKPKPSCDAVVLTIPNQWILQIGQKLVDCQILEVPWERYTTEWNGYSTTREADTVIVQ